VAASRNSGGGAIKMVEYGGWESNSRTVKWYDRFSRFSSGIDPV